MVRSLVPPFSIPLFSNIAPHGRPTELCETIVEINGHNGRPVDGFSRRHGTFSSGTEITDLNCARWFDARFRATRVDEKWTFERYKFPVTVQGWIRRTWRRVADENGGTYERF